MKTEIQAGFVPPEALEWTRANYGISALSVHERAISMLRAQAQNPPSLKLDVNGGAYSFNGVTRLFAGGQSPEFTAPASGTRLDILYLNGASGELVIQQGTAAVAITDPLNLPSVPSGAIPLVAVHLATGQTKIVESDLYDLRAFFAMTDRDFVLIDSTVLTSAVTSVTFSSIPSFVDLLITGVARTDRSVIADSVMLRFNGDTGNNYDRLKFNIQSTGYVTYVNRAASAIWFNRCEAAKATSQTFSPLWGFIPSYRNTSAYKYFVSGMTFTRATAGADTDLYLGYCGGCWRSTSAITSITLLPDVGTNFVSGCMFYLWGCK